MTDHSTTTAPITQPLFAEYVQALLPALSSKNEDDQATADNEDGHAATLLWVVQHQDDIASTRAQLQSLCEADDSHQHDEQAHIVSLQTLAMQPVPKRYQLACFWLPELTTDLLAQYLPTLMRYRDLYAAHQLIVLDSKADLRPYGFTPSEDFADTDSGRRVWQFNLYDYKHLPNWLNSQYWANPENWDKNRW